MDKQILDFDVAVIGGGAGGLAAALAASQKGASVVVVEREQRLGGILQQCIHNGFGLHRFGEELTGPEYAYRDVVQVEKDPAITQLLDTFALKAEKTAGGDFLITITGPHTGYAQIRSKAMVLACGCRERSRGQIGLAGTRPAGIYTAGTAQKLMNTMGCLVGKEVVILGSGDIGLIMARRMTWEKAHVICVCELASEPGGLQRNLVQCLDDFGIPLHLSTTVIQVIGKDRLEAVDIAQVDPVTKQVVEGSRKRIPCDTLLLSVGLIPENSLAQTLGLKLDPATQGPAIDQDLMCSLPGVFVAGNQLHVHDLVDYVSEEGGLAGANAALWAQGAQPSGRQPQDSCRVVAGQLVDAITPQLIDDKTKPVTIRFRVKGRLEKAAIQLISDGGRIKQVKRLVVVPSEMQTLYLKADEVSQLKDSLTVQVVPQESAKASNDIKRRG